MSFLDTIKKDLNNSGSDGLWKPKDNKNTIRLLPALKSSGVDVPWVLSVVHYGLPLPEEGSSAVHCSRINYRMEGGKLRGEGSCPICDLVFKLYKGDDEDKKLARSISAKPMWYVNILDLSDKTNLALEPRVYRFSKMVYNELINCFKVSKNKKGEVVNPNDFDTYDEDELETDVVDITHYLKGYKLQLIKAPKSDKNDYVSYKMLRSSNPSSVIKTEKEKTKLEGKMTDLSTFIKPVDAKLLAKNARRLNNEDVEDGFEETDDEFSEINNKDDDFPLKEEEKKIEFNEEDDSLLLDEEEVKEEPVKKTKRTKRTKKVTKEKKTESLIDEDDLEDDDLGNLDFLDE